MYSWLRKSVHMNLIVSLIRLIKIFFKVLSQFDIKRKSQFTCMTYKLSNNGIVLKNITGFKLIFLY
jgi:hypothetical protein